jgi:hypothetical protein
VTRERLAAVRLALQAAEAEVARLAAEEAAAVAELQRLAAEARERAAQERAATEALEQRVEEHFDQASAPELNAELEQEPARIREESLIRWAVRELRETGAFGHVFALVPEVLHAEVERRYEAERAAWGAQQGRLAELEASVGDAAEVLDEAALAGQQRAHEREQAELEQRVAKHFAEVEGGVA